MLIELVGLVSGLERKGVVGNGIEYVLFVLDLHVWSALVKYQRHYDLVLWPKMYL
jgi:hypothetical protein